MTTLVKKMLPPEEEMKRFDKDFMEGYFRALGAVREILKEDLTAQELYELLIDTRQKIYDVKCQKTGEKKALLWE